MEVLKLKTPKQCKDAYALIKKLCCNYDRSTGSCLLLERTDIVKCPQLISQSLICRYFRDVLLEDKEARELKAEIMGDSNRKVCAVCGEHFRAVSNRAKYCARCAKKMERERKSEWAKKNRVRVDV